MQSMRLNNQYETDGVKLLSSHTIRRSKLVSDIHIICSSFLFTWSSNVLQLDCILSVTSWMWILLGLLRDGINK